MLPRLAPVGKPPQQLVRRLVAGLADEQERPAQLRHGRHGAVGEPYDREPLRHTELQLGQRAEQLLDVLVDADDDGGRTLGRQLVPQYPRVPLAGQLSV